MEKAVLVDARNKCRAMAASLRCCGASEREVCVLVGVEGRVPAPPPRAAAASPPARAAAAPPPPGRCDVSSPRRSVAAAPRRRRNRRRVALPLVTALRAVSRLCLRPRSCARACVCVWLWASLPAPVREVPAPLSRASNCGCASIGVCGRACARDRATARAPAGARLAPLAASASTPPSLAATTPAAGAPLPLGAKLRA